MSEHIKFGDFLSEKRKQKSIPSLEMSKRIGISPSYYCDIEKNRKVALERELIEKIIKAFNFSKEDSVTVFDLAAKARAHISMDLPQYIMENEVVRVALRIAKDKADMNDWNEFISKLKNKE